MNHYEAGKADGKSQFEMDKLTETHREGELLIHTALNSIHLGTGPDRISVSEYVGGFVEGYLIAIIGKRKDECEKAASLYDDIESSKWRYIPLETVNRKQYAISAQVDLLQTILSEIGAGA